MLTLAIPAACIPTSSALACVVPLAIPVPCIPQPAFLRAAFLSLVTIGMYDRPRPFLRAAFLGLVTIGIYDRPRRSSQPRDDRHVRST
ncbi:hypothetical protein CALVIDRAFT_532756 [Calocera viscosa TUFC12733]|uniref:Secreted protein n=1 Tax=Calocera viscosa (strain TUFC12733) TaxID=1330018 RepID=A0A167RPU1_CALVF|nr:hypothetical protein CALVIDRAFT_532756 [Calocera viscosa TUFC12733]